MSKIVAGGAITYYLYYGDFLIAEIYGGTAGGGGGAGPLTPIGGIVKSYHWGPTGLISDRVGGASRCYLYVRTGNTRAIVDPTGAVLQLHRVGRISDAELK